MSQPITEPGRDHMWRKSSYSQGASNCVETSSYRKSSHSIGHDEGNCVEAASYRKSSHSIHNGQCAEVAHGGGFVRVRDTTQAGDPARTVIEVPARAWRKFVGDLR